MDKRVLDVGCNEGRFSTAIASLMGARQVVGIDVDPEMVRRARRYLAARASLVQQQGNKLEDIPLAAPTLLGTMVVIEDRAGLHDDTHMMSRPLNTNSPSRGVFPHNVIFRCGNAVTEPVVVTSSDRSDCTWGTYDVVLALSVTKWIHVQTGDAGLRLFFKKCFQWLRKGGVLVVEPQPWEGDGYARARRKAKGGMEIDTSSTRTRTMCMRPDEFPSFLLHEVGFSSVEKLGESPAQAKGFRREVFAFFK